MDTFHVYQAKDGWRWRRVAANGKVVSESGEAYTRKDDCEEAAAREANGLDAKIVVGAWTEPS